MWPCYIRGIRKELLVRTMPAPGDPERRDPIVVVNVNSKPGDDFSVYYSLDAPADVAPCHDTRSDIGGSVCK